MRISDWSSDVCSSDLRLVDRQLPVDLRQVGAKAALRRQRVQLRRRIAERQAATAGQGQGEAAAGHHATPGHESARHQFARSEEHTSELQSLMRISYAVFCLKKKIQITSISRKQT